jgi:hypothetical protein
MTNCAFTNKDLVNIVDIGYQDSGNYRVPAFAVLERGLVTATFKETTINKYLSYWEQWRTLNRSSFNHYTGTLK